jgi:hypothetical protein
MATAPAVLLNTSALTPPGVDVPGEAPLKRLDSNVLRELGSSLMRLFDLYAQDRQLTELKYIRNLRQYLGIYDPEVEQELPKGGSRAYPRITRVKCISMLARIMNLMFPGNERNWECNASPSAEMSPDDVKQAVADLQAQYGKDGQQAPELSDELIDAAVQRLADNRAAALSKLIDDQLQEIGGDQTLDYISLNRKVAFSGIQYGLGVLEGPYLREEKKILWGSDGQGGFATRERTIRKPLYEFVSVWDFYPDLSAKTLSGGEGYFIRKVMGRADLRKLANRADFFGEEIKKYLTREPKGNYTPKTFESELKVLGTKANVNEQAKEPHGKYELIVWKGPVSAQKLSELGADIPQTYMADDIEAEVWMVGGFVIKADVNPWRKMGCEVKTIHTFVFDEDDTSPIGNGLPNVVRDSQMSVCAAVRMALDNASVVCGPILEANTALLRPGQDTSSIHAYKVFERDDDNPMTAQWPAVREIKIDSHLDELSKLVEMFMAFADMETFIGPATGGDMQKAPSEPMRTAAGQSMVKGDAALPFKDIIRNFDFFTQSVILSLVHFNRKFNPQVVKEGDYDVVARGATSLIAKEVRGMQTDILAQTMTPEDRDWIDEEKFMRQRMAVRDMEGLMVPAEEALRKRAARQAAQAQISELEMEGMRAEIRKTLAEAFKNITQGQKNAAAADAAVANTALEILEVGMNDEGQSGAPGADRPAN